MGLTRSWLYETGSMRHLRTAFLSSWATELPVFRNAFLTLALFLRWIGAWPKTKTTAQKENDMSKRILITFGGKAYDAQTEQQRNFLLIDNPQHARNYEHKVYDDRWLASTPFYAMNRWIFDRRPQHGFGFCSWKPYIILHALRTFAQTGDVVMYLDADTYPIADISCLFEHAGRGHQKGIMLFEEQGCVNKTWIKGDCFDAMQVDGKGPTEAMHACGRFQLFKKGNWFNEQFLMEWLTYSLNPKCQFHEGSVIPGIDDASFLRNSCEQSVLSLLAFKYDIPLHRTPDQNGWPIAHDGTYKPEDRYQQLFVQDGSRGNIGDVSGSRFRNVE
jgi:hypothetical protein